MMREIDVLTSSSIDLFRRAPIETNKRRILIWNLEQLHIHYKIDAGGFELSETDQQSNYTKLSPFSMAEAVTHHAADFDASHLIYDWSAFLLNFWESHGFASTNDITGVQEQLMPLKKIYWQHNFANYKPIHATLTVYSDGFSHFSDAQNAVIKWFTAQNH